MTEDDPRRELRRILESLARERATVTYRDLAQLAGIAPPRSIHRLTEELEAMMREDHARGDPLLASLAVSRGAGGIPQRGYFQLLQALGRYDGPDQGPEAEEVFCEELELAWEYWGSRSRGQAEPARASRQAAPDALGRREGKHTRRHGRTRR